MGLCFVVYMFLSYNPSSGDINLSCFFNSSSVEIYHIKPSNGLKAISGTLKLIIKL